MRNFLLGILIALIAAIGIFYFMNPTKEPETKIESSDLILEQINNVGKLVVTEGHFAEVITYKNAKTFYLDILSAEKKAIVVVNAKATIAYDLSKIKPRIDAQTKTVTITELPNPEINIIPEITYHDLKEDLLNPFTPEDHNLIQKKVIDTLHQKIARSSLSQNAQNRLISELQKIYILTNSMGWKLNYQETTVDHNQTFDTIFKNEMLSKMAN